MIEKRPWFLYRMRCLVEGVGDYFGITIRPFDRDKEHLRFRKGAKLRAAIELFGPEQFTYEIVGTYGTEVDARRAEREHIAIHGTGWPNGLNVQGSGRRMTYVPLDVVGEHRRIKTQIALWDAQRKELKASERALRRVLGLTERQIRSANSKLRKIDESTREKLRKAALVGKFRLPEARRKQSESMKALWATPERRAKMCSGRKPKQMPDAERAAVGARSRKKWSSEIGRKQYLSALKAGWQGEKGEARKQKLRDRWADPEFKAKNLAAMQAKRPDYSSPEVLAGIKAGQQRRRERERAERALRDGEVAGNA